jgi:DNA-binding NarL/FixJ family response regulator
VKILIADDNAQLRHLLRSSIQGHAGWTVCAEAENGVEAVAKAKEFQPDLVVLDLAMPRMNGLNAAREISRELPGVLILMHTLYASPIVEMEAKKCGVERVIAKATSHMLVPAIEQAFAQMPQRKPAQSESAGSLQEQTDRTNSSAT